MKFFRPPSDRWRFLVITCVTASLVIWVGLIPELFRLSSQFFDPQPPVPSALTAVSPPIAAIPKPALSRPMPPLATSPTANPKPQPSFGTDDVFEFEHPRLKPPASGTFAPQIPSQQAVAPLHGHLPYQEDEPQRLVSVGTYYDRPESLDFEAAGAFKQMQSDAAIAGVKLTPISGFRTIAEQQKLFERQIQRQGSEAAAARLSAPPGYSEHHTGYVLDIGDRSLPSQDLKFGFEDTPAYQWLVTHARSYGFELSFPPNNLQQVSFEPWHWRYVGSGRAAGIFALARSQFR
jgi:zinc D-Ala-D-Ala carboxypeptidase